jgi:hypothetical protein
MEGTVRTAEQETQTSSTESADAYADQSPGAACHLEAARRHAIPPLPPLPDRWLPHRKAEVVAAVRNGVLSLDKARERYSLSIEEYLAWERAIDRFGLPGLRVNAPQLRRLKTHAARE